MQSRDSLFSTIFAETLRSIYINFKLTGGQPARKHAMLRQILLNSTDTHDFDLVMAQSTHSPATLNSSHGSVSVAALLRPTGRGGLREGELNKPDLTTYIVICLVLFLVVLLIVFFINCQLRNSFFASMPYDRSLREARSSYK